MDPNAMPFVPNPKANVFIPSASPVVPNNTSSNGLVSSPRWECMYPMDTVPLNNQRVYSIDVECVATGPGHAARTPCSVVIIDYHLTVVLSAVIKPSVPVFNYLTEITGYKEGDLDEGETLEAVLAKVHGVLDPDVLLVGQSIISDVRWMQLVKGQHYVDLVELTDWFSVFNPRYNRMSFYSLDHVAMVLLGVDLCCKGFHDPSDDAAASMELYRRYVEYGEGATKEALAQACSMLSSVPTRPSFAKRCNWSLHGVCMAVYTPSKCTCSDPPFDRINQDDLSSCSSPRASNLQC